MNSIVDEYLSKLVDRSHSDRENGETLGGIHGH